MVNTSLPPLPKIEGDVELLLDVFTHKSLRMPDTPLNEDYGDTDRLAELGAYVLRLVVATHWFHAANPPLAVDALQEKISSSLADDTIDSWMDAYGLKSKLRIAPSEMQLINSTKEMRKMFETYVGAVYHRNRSGFREIQEWISRLIDPDGAAMTLEGIPSHSKPGIPAPAPTPAPSYTQYAPQPSQPQPPPPQSPPPPMPSGSYGLGNTVHGMGMNTGYGSPQPPGNHMLNMVSVALLNQKATQNGYQVTYPAEHTGPPHAPTWNVRCCLNGKECGRGTGKSQKVAKEEAARQAWSAMGW